MKCAIAVLLVGSPWAMAGDRIVYTGGSQRYEAFVDTTPGDGGPPDDSFLLVLGLDPDPCCAIEVSVARQVPGGTVSGFAGGSYLGIDRSHYGMMSESLAISVFNVPAGAAAQVFTRFTNIIDFTIAEGGPMEFVGFASTNQLPADRPSFCRAEFRITAQGQTEPIFELLADDANETDRFIGVFHIPAGNYTLFDQVETNFLGNGSISGDGGARVSFFMEKIIATPCASDFDDSGIVDFGDLTSVLANWGATGQAFRPGDADGNGAVEFGDITTVLANFGLPGCG